MSMLGGAHIRQATRAAGVSIATVSAILLGVSRAHAADEMILHWRFDSPYRYGFVEPDASGNSNDGLLVWARTRGGGGGEYAPGQGVFGGAATVKGRGSFFTRTPFTVPSEWTLSFWVKPADQIGRTDTIVTLTDSSRKEALVNLGNRGQRFSLNIRHAGKTVGKSFDAKGAYKLDAWHHVLITYGNNAMAFHLDGKKHQSSHELPWRPGAKLHLRLAGSRGGAHNRFTGLYDDVRIYGTVLDDARIARLANPKSDFYKQEPPPLIADPGGGYSAKLRGGRARAKLDGGTLCEKRAVGEVSYRWDVVDQPTGARGVFADRTRADTEFTADKAGAYRLKLTVSHKGGSDSALVHAAIHRDDFAPGRPARPFKREPWSLLKIGDLEPSRKERVDACKGPSAPVAYWTFDETGGTTARGTGPQGRAVTLNQTMSFSTDGKVGGALHLEPQKRVHAVVEFGVIPKLKDEFTLAFWIKSERTDKRATLFKVAGGNGESYCNVGNQHNKGGLPPGYSVISFGGGADIHLGGRWNHVAVCYSNKGDFRKLYINGYLVSARKFQPLNDKATGDPRLVFNGPGLNYAFRGMLDDVAVYGATLNNEEVWKICHEGVPSLTRRVAEDPYKTGAYRKAFVEKWFPELTPKRVEGRGFAEERFDADALPAYEHPRLFFSATDLPRLRATARTRAGNYVLSQLRQHSEIAVRTDDKGRYTRKFDMYGAGAMLARAYVALLEADTGTARRIVDWMMACAERQKAEVEKQRGKLDDWQHSGHDIMLRYGTPLLYDWMYAWMTPEERDTVRRLIAVCTRDRWSIGMYGQPAWSAHISNWEPWITGELMLALQSIYNEDGFCSETYQAASRATQLCALLMGDEESGASYEGMAKNNMQLEMYALVSRTQPRGQKLIGSQMPYNHAAKFLFHCMAPWGGAIMKDDALGGMSRNLEDVSVAVMHYAYPDDPIINYMKHNTTGQAEGYTKLNLNTFFQNSPPMIWSFVQDWRGPEDVAEHLKAATKAGGEPLGYFSNYRGLMISRSDWTPDALQLYYQPRSVQGGHPIPARGLFRLNALGRIWVPFEGGYPHQQSKYHSVVTVDGVGQDNTVGKVLSYEGAAETKGAFIDMMGGDLTGAYRQTRGRMYMTYNDARLRPDTERPWMGMDKRFAVHWWRADRPGANVSMPAEDWVPGQEFAYAYRTAALVRPSTGSGQAGHAYVLIIDDIKKDDRKREYNWSMMIPQDIYKATSFELEPDRAVLTDPIDPTRHLLVLPISYKGDAAFDAKEMYGEWRDKKGHVYKLNFRCRSDAPAFRMLLYPYRDGYPLPEVEGTNGRFTITIGAQKDVLTVEAKPARISRVRISRGGLADAGRAPVAAPTGKTATRAGEPATATPSRGGEPAPAPAKAQPEYSTMTYAVIGGAVLLAAGAAVFAATRKGGARTSRGRRGGTRRNGNGRR